MYGIISLNLYNPRSIHTSKQSLAHVIIYLIILSGDTQSPLIGSDEEDAMEQQILDQCVRVAWAEKGTSKIAPFRHRSKVSRIKILTVSRKILSVLLIPK